jgi:hypothetical protein
MTDKIDAVIASIMAKRAEDLANANEKQSVLEREETRKQAAAQAANDLRAKIDAFVADLNARLQVADIAVVLSVLPGDKDGELISHYSAAFAPSSRGVDPVVTTKFEIGASGIANIFVSAPDDAHARQTFEFNAATMNEEDIADVFARFLQLAMN